MGRFFDRAKDFFSGTDLQNEEAARRARWQAEWNAQQRARIVAHKAAIRRYEQANDEALQTLAPFMGRLILVANFGRLPDEFTEKIITDEVATPVAALVHDSDLKLGISAHANQGHLHGKGGISYAHSAHLLQSRLNDMDINSLITSGSEFQSGLGLPSIAEAVQSTVEHYNDDARDIGHVAIVSALEMDEVGLGYPSSGEAFLLDGYVPGDKGWLPRWKALNPPPPRPRRR